MFTVAGRTLAAVGAAVVVVVSLVGSTASLAETAGAAGQSGAALAVEVPASSPSSTPALDVGMARMERVRALLSEHGVNLVAVTDEQPCEGQPTPFVDETTGDWQLIGCNVDGVGVWLSKGVLSPVVSWEDVEYLTLHEAAHDAEKAAGCDLVRSVEDRERLADAIAVRYGADPTVTTNGPKKADYELADQVLSEGTCG